MKSTHDSSFPTPFSSEKNKGFNEKHLDVTDDNKQEKSLGKKSSAILHAKSSKGLKRNLKNWEAFIAEDDETAFNDDKAGLPYDEELDLGLEEDTIVASKKESKKRKQA
jgi:hypothetical protein